jgi:hypothetical protein
MYADFYFTFRTKYDTLGVTWDCTNMTQHLTKTCSNDTIDPVHGAACDWSLPNGMNLGADGRTLFALNMSLPSTQYPDFDNPLAVVHSITNYIDDFINATSPVFAAECILYPVVLTLNTSVGQWSVDNSPDKNNPIIPLNTPDKYYETIVDVYNGYRYVSADDNRASAGYLLEPPPSPANSSNSKDNTYRLSNQAAVSITRYLKTLLQGSIQAIGADNFTYTAELNGGGNSDVLQVIHDPSSNVCFTSGVGYTLTFGEMPNVMCAMDGIAAALTVMMRNNQNVSLIPGEQALSAFGHQGLEISPLVQINVTWWWIILPIVIWCCSIAMLIGTVVKTRRAKVHLWRTNPLAMVFLQLGHDERAAITEHALTEEGLVKRAENMKVQLVVNQGDGIVLRKVQAP